MTSRLYPSKRFTYRQVAQVLRPLGAAAVGGPAFFDLLCLYVTGLVLLDKRQNATRILVSCLAAVTMH